VDVTLVRAKEWQAVCPKCEKIAASHESDMRCPNCNSTAGLYIPVLGGGQHWQSEQAESSWHQIKCDKDCGWYSTQLDCPSCGSTIQGKFLEDLRKCFVATTCFGDSQHPIVKAFRRYRDQYIANSVYGAEFINWYYRKGPAYAELIEHRPVAKWCIRQVLKLALLFLPKELRTDR